jgi:hypothetical protein
MCLEQLFEEAYQKTCVEGCLSRQEMQIIIIHISNNSVRVRSWKPPNWYSNHIYCDQIVKEFQFFTNMIWRIHSKMVINVGNMADMNEESTSFESQVHTKGFVTCNHLKLCPLFWWALGGQRRLHTRQPH